MPERSYSAFSTLAANGAYHFLGVAIGVHGPRLPDIQTATPVPLGIVLVPVLSDIRAV